MPKPNLYHPVPLPGRPLKSGDEMEAEAKAFLNEMRLRHTVRDFDTRPVSEDVITDCIRAAGTAPSGANHQPWHFVAINDPDIKARIRTAAEAEEKRFYNGAAGEEWLTSLEPLGTDISKPHLQDAPWLIVVFAQRYGLNSDGSREKHYYVPESVGIACGILLTALHLAGLETLTHTPNPMGFLRKICKRPENEKPLMIIAVGHAASDATIPSAATKKKSLDQILTVIRESNT